MSTFGAPVESRVDTVGFFFTTAEALKDSRIAGLYYKELQQQQWDERHVLSVISQPWSTYARTKALNLMDNLS